MDKPDLLYLVHRIPYPPNKGDKLRSFNLLKFLAQSYRVHLGCFVDYSEDWLHVAALDEWCTSKCVQGIRPRWAKLAALRGLLRNEALTLPYYRNAAMAMWVRETVARHKIKRIVVFCSSMAQYLQGLPDLAAVVDFVDVDSAKWTRYAEDRSGLMAWLYRREGVRLAAFERRVAETARASVLVSEAEADLFRQVVGTSAASARITAIGNGVNAAFFTPDPARASPYPSNELPVVFTGAMDYWPNIDAVCAFADEVWPGVLAQYPAARFYIVGMNPSEAVRALAERPGIAVTGTVPDVRPWIQHARLVVAPLRVARGVQNKILEAMAMERAVVASATCAVGIDATVDEAFCVADSVAEWQQSVASLLANEARCVCLGSAARARILTRYAWEAQLAPFKVLIEQNA